MLCTRLVCNLGEILAISAGAASTQSPAADSLAMACCRAWAEAMSHSHLCSVTAACRGSSSSRCTAHALSGEEVAVPLPAELLPPSRAWAAPLRASGQGRALQHCTGAASHLREMGIAISPGPLLVPSVCSPNIPAGSVS